MRDAGRHAVAGVAIDCVDYDVAVERVLRAARDGRHLGVSALAVHGVMTGHDDPQQRERLRGLDLVVPDGQPVRWALNALHGVGLPDRVYGPELARRVCAAAAAEGLAIYLYGSTPEVLASLEANLRAEHPGLVVAGSRPSLFRTASAAEQRTIAAEIAASGARICLVGLGCPRQEVFVHEHRDLLPMPMLAVGAAFDFHAGLLAQAPRWMQDRGLEWLFRLTREPRRLWRRYLVLNPRFVLAVLRQRAGRPVSAASRRPDPIRYA
jgi:exopolysaccharide biosynthesis WecB/TagA/CpsF family protein